MADVNRDAGPPESDDPIELSVARSDVGNGSETIGENRTARELWRELDPDGGTGTNRSTTRRGRRKNGGTEETETLVPVEKPKRQSTSRVTEQEFGMLFVMIFAIIAAVRGKHWKKTESQVAPLSDVAVAYVNSLPVAKAKKVKRGLLPITAIIAAIQVLAEPLSIELEAARIQKQMEQENPNENSQPITNSGSPFSSPQPGAGTGYQPNQYEEPGTPNAGGGADDWRLRVGGHG